LNWNCPKEKKEECQACRRYRILHLIIVGCLGPWRSGGKEKQLRHYTFGEGEVGWGKEPRQILPKHGRDPPVTHRRDDKATGYQFEQKTYENTFRENQRGKLLKQG